MGFLKTTLAVASGVLLAGAIAAAGTVAFHTLRERSAARGEASARTQLRIEQAATERTRNGDVVASGTLTNAAETPLTNVHLAVDLIDPMAGEVRETAVVEAVGFTPLGPGETRAWQVSVPWAGSMTPTVKTRLLPARPQ